jgi:hypothetical protein
VTVIDRDLGFRALRRRVAATARERVTVGVHEDVGGEDHGEGITIAEIAAFHEFGTASIPERSFIRAGIDENRDRIRDLQRRLAKLVIANRTRMPPRRALELLGAKIATLIRERIRASIDPPLADSTVDRKGSSTPLIDTGQLIQSIAFKVT